MISLRLVQLIERHSDELATELVAKLENSSRTSELHKVPAEELRRRIHEILQHLSEWLITKTGHDIEQRYFEIGERRASQGVALSDFCWAIATRASSAAPSKSMARWNCCACWTSFSIVHCVL